MVKVALTAKEFILVRELVRQAAAKSAGGAGGPRTLDLEVRATTPDMIDFVALNKRLNAIAAQEGWANDKT